MLLSWLGLLGSALGGMDPRNNNPPLTDRPYDFTPDLSTLQGLPIHVWSTKSPPTRWSLPIRVCLQRRSCKEEDDVLSGELTSRLNAAGRLLAGLRPLGVSAGNGGAGSDAGAAALERP